MKLRPNALLAACAHNHTDVAAFLMLKRADPNMVLKVHCLSCNEATDNPLTLDMPTQYRRTALMEACDKNNYQLVSLLLAHEADINHTNRVSSFILQSLHDI